jgi:hypothetical protein
MKIKIKKREPVKLKVAWGTTSDGEDFVWEVDFLPFNPSQRVAIHQRSSTFEDDLLRILAESVVGIRAEGVTIEREDGSPIDWSQDAQSVLSDDTVFGFAFACALYREYEILVSQPIDARGEADG